MLLLFVGGVMNLVWIAGLTLLVAVEKLAPFGAVIARAMGTVLIAGGAALIAAGLDPETAARSAAHRHGLAAAALHQQTTVTATGLMSVIGEWA